MSARSNSPLHPALDATAIRHAGRELLSLALIDARNHSLQLMTQFESALAATQFQVPRWPGLLPPLWLLGHIGWFAEWWIARNLQRHLGSRCNAQTVHLPSLLAQADDWWGFDPHEPEKPWADGLPDFATIKTYLLETLEVCLELLEKAPENHDALYFFRLALLHEDLQAQQLISMAQVLGLPLQWQRPAALASRSPLWLPASPWRLGSGAEAGFAFDNEQPALLVQLPEFEIDAQAVSWAQYVEFVDDGGYDDVRCWQPDGWNWLQDLARTQGRRAPRYVDQIGVASGAVLQTRFGQSTRMQGQDAAMHVSWWEADAWCRWAGRRLPSEVEWELAASGLHTRGFRWGDVWEWTGTTFNAYPGFQPGPWRDYSVPFFGAHKVLRGGAYITAARLKHPKFRYFLPPESDHMFTGFRSCAL